MGRRGRGMMSEQMKYELAKDLGFYQTVEREGWGAIRAKDAGNMVKRAIQIAEQKLAQSSQSSVSGASRGYAAFQQNRGAGAFADQTFRSTHVAGRTNPQS